MPAKMISEMPLPMPRSVICSPSHMMNAVPVVSEIIVIRRKPQPGSAHDVAVLPPSVPFRPSRNSAMPVLWTTRQHDRAVARVLVDLALPGSPSLRSSSSGWNDHGHQLQDDARRDVRHDAEREDRELLERAAREQVEHAEERARLLLAMIWRITLRSTPGVVTKMPMR